MALTGKILVAIKTSNCLAQFSPKPYTIDGKKRLRKCVNVEKIAIFGSPCRRRGRENGIIEFLELFPRLNKFGPKIADFCIYPDDGHHDSYHTASALRNSYHRTDQTVSAIYEPRTQA
jgi:hypothetical protein